MWSVTYRYCYTEDGLAVAQFVDNLVSQSVVDLYTTEKRIILRIKHRMTHSIKHRMTHSRGHKRRHRINDIIRRDITL